MPTGGHRLEGLADVRRAIDLEASERWDYAARIAEYEGTAARVESICLRRQLTGEVEVARAEIEGGSRSQVLTMTGLLAAVVAIIVVNIGSSRTTAARADVVSSILVGNGSVILGGFGLLITLVLIPQNRTSRMLSVIVPAIGLGLLLLGYFMPEVPSSP